MLLGLAAMWGGSFLFIRVAVPSLGPFVLTEVRLVLAATTLAAVLLVSRTAVRPVRPLRSYVGLGLVNAGIPFTLIALAEQHISASLAAIVNSSMPMFAALVAAAWLGVPLTRMMVAGLAMGIGGVALVVGFAPQHVDLTFLLACGASLAAALLYAIGANWIKRSFTGESPVVLAFVQIASAAVLFAPTVAVAPAHDSSPPLKAILCMVALAVFGTAAAYILYFRLIAEVGATSAATVTLLVPVFGVFWGAIFLDEHVTLGTVLGGALIISSITLVTGTGIPGRRRAGSVPLG
jgi:drug/metabolite transporter (DMT)-like permease